MEEFEILAEYLEDKKLFSFAEKLLCEILDFRKAYLTPNHPDIGLSMNNLATVLLRLNRL